MFVAVSVGSFSVVLHRLQRQKQHEGFMTLIQEIKTASSLQGLTYLSVFLSFLDCMLIQFMQLSGIKLGEFGDKYPQVSGK